MNVGDAVELILESLAFGGDAVARKDGWVFFVQGGLPGETVLAEITEKKTNFYRAQIKSIVQPSAHRQESPCPYFPQCGGCQYLHLQYGAQVQAKLQQVQDVLTRIGKITFPAIKTVPCKEPLHYRNRVKLHVYRKVPSLRAERSNLVDTAGLLRRDAPRNDIDATDSNLQLGFMNATGRKIVPIEHCLISGQAINDSLSTVREHIKTVPEAKTVTIRTTPEGKTDFWTQNLPLSKDNILTEKVRDKIFQAPSASFFQVNPAMTEELVNAVEGFLNPDSEVLIDAYCGVGLFSVVLGKRFGQIIGIEEDQNSVRWARKNMQANGIAGGIFYEGRVERMIEKALEKTQGKKLTVILDPPRDGVHRDVLSGLAKARPQQIIYVSCNPPTLARDLNRLSNSYKIAGITLLDMFPQTMHCEVIASLA